MQRNNSYNTTNNNTNITRRAAAARPMRTQRNNSYNTTNNNNNTTRRAATVRPMRTPRRLSKERQQRTNENARKADRMRRYQAQMQSVARVIYSALQPIESRNIRVRHDPATDMISIIVVACPESHQHYASYTPYVTIKIPTKTMKIELLTSCNPLSGSDMLDRFINLARIMKLTSVVLYDESEAYFHPSTYGRNDCHLPLAYLRTLMRGKSWYQSRGFVTNHNQEYSEHNEHTRNMRFDDFVTQVTIKHFNSPDESEDQLNSIMEIFPGVTPEMKVSDAFQLMSDQTNDVGSTVCESKQFTTLKMLVESCLIGSDDDPPLIMYEDDLRTLTLSPSP